MVEREEFRNRSAQIPNSAVDDEFEDDPDFDPVAYARSIRRSRGDRRA
jgi:hypothetical protein